VVWWHSQCTNDFVCQGHPISTRDKTSFLLLTKNGFMSLVEGPLITKSLTDGIILPSLLMHKVGNIQFLIIFVFSQFLVLYQGEMLAARCMQRFCSQFMYSSILLIIINK
jgi:hypothetical protein